MTRLYLVVEGQTEEAFCKDLLIPHLAGFGVFGQVTIVQTRDKQSGAVRGKGGGHWRTWRTHLTTLMKQQRHEDTRFTTMFDVYGLPRSFPGLAGVEPVQDRKLRVERLERALAEDISDPRLVPYLQCYEFETLVLAGLDQLEGLLEDPVSVRGVEKLRTELAGLAPEEVNDGAETAPSKRLRRHVPEYVKTTYGALVTHDLGLAALRTRCPRFGAWVEKLERLGSSSA